MLALWTRIVEHNAFPPPSKVSTEVKASEATRLQPLFRTLVERFIVDLPGPLPTDTFDPESARACGLLVAAGLRRLKEPTPLAEVVAALQAPRTPAQHVTQAAILWHAIPIVLRLRSEAFQAINRKEGAGEAKEEVSERLGALLADRPLLSLRADTKTFFIHEDPPVLDGLRDALGLRRWLVQRLADSQEPVSRQAATLRRIAAEGTEWTSDFRDILALNAASGDPVSAEWLIEFIPLLDAGAWPEDLAPALRARARTLKGAP